MPYVQEDVQFYGKPGRDVALVMEDGDGVLWRIIADGDDDEFQIQRGTTTVFHLNGTQVTISNGDGSTNLVPEVQILGTAQADASLLLACFNTTDATPPSLNFLKSGNAAIGSNTVVASGERLGDINWFGDDGTDYESPAASIRGMADAAAGTGDMPGRLVFLTTTDAGETLTERARLTGTATVATLAVGVAGATTGRVALAGTTSGVVTVSPAAVAGTWTMQLPAAVGTAGQQLTDTTGDGICAWAAASLGAWKNDLGILDPEEALRAVISAPTHRFTYRKEVMPAGQWAPPDEMYGIFSEEAPWAMHGRNGIAFSQINSFGYARAAIEALANKVEVLEARLAAVA